MAKTHRLSMTAAVIVSFVSVLGNGTLFASDDLTNSTSNTQISTSEELAPPIEHPRFTLDAGFLAANPSLGLPAPDARTFNFVPAEPSAAAAQVYRGRPYRIGRGGSIAALMIGTAAAITGAAILVYANRPECDISPSAGGCGYGTKVTGVAVLSGGIAGIFIGALTWR
jgi:hypothetical protein